MTDVELKAIEAREAAATPGPWNDFGPCRACNELHLMDSDSVGGCQNKKATAQDLEFIAIAREFVPALVAEVRRLRAVIGLVPYTRCNQCNECPWCHSDGYSGRHEAECVAFTENAEVK